MSVNSFSACDKSPTGIYFFKFNNGNTRTMCEICSKLKIKTPDRNQWRRSGGVFIVSFDLISHLLLVFYLNFVELFHKKNSKAFKFELEEF